ncbi:MAG: hypothetical protein IEMM0003_0949 [bacterium]|nr:MAG: hypothetical protein IEMM0003_0949 [bacterium]
MITAAAITKDKNGKIKTEELIICRNLLFAVQDDHLWNSRNAVY